MIKFNLKSILNEHNMSQHQFSKMSKVRPNTINNIYNNTLRRLEIDTLEKIMSVLNEMGYTISDFILYEYEKDDLIK